MPKHYAIKVWGQVQGVNFRTNAKQAADVLGLSGWVKNEPDGSVSIEAEGDEKSLDSFVAWCKQGSAEASVAKVDVSENTPKNFAEFMIIG